MASCITGKRMYSSLEIAEDALIEAWTRYDYAPNNGPIAVYNCTDCGAFHLTSKGIMNEKLFRYIKEGKIDRQKEADRWLNKIKKK